MKESDVNQKLRTTISSAYKHAPEVRERFDTAGVRPEDIKTTEDLARVPVRTKDEIIALQQANPPFGGLLAVPTSELTHIFFSPGPLYEPGAEDDTTPYEMAELVFQQSGFVSGDVILNSLSYHLVPAGLLVDRALTNMGCIVIPGGVGNSDLQLKMMKDHGVTGYVGTPSFLMQLIEKAEEAGLDFKKDFRLEKMVTTAEPLPLSLRQRFVDEYSMAVGNCYATAELGLLALDTAGQMAMRLMPQPVIQVVDPETGSSVGPGEAGEVVVTNFSRVYPLIRFGTGDLALNVDPNPGQSKQEERSVLLVGRRGEAVKVRGMFVHPNQIRFALQQIGITSAFQGVVTRPETRDHLTIRIAAAGLSKAEVDLDDEIKENVRNACRVRVDEVEFVKPEAIPADAPGMVDGREW